MPCPSEARLADTASRERAWCGAAALCGRGRAATRRGRGLRGGAATPLLSGYDRSARNNLTDEHRLAIAGLAGLVQRARDEGDAVASQILVRAATELAGAAASVIGRLGMRGDAFPTVLGGGIFRGVPWLKGDVEARLSEVAPRSIVRILDVEPAVGAVRLAIAAAHGSVAIPAYIEAG